MGKNKKAAAIPASVGVAAPHYGVRTGQGAVVEQFMSELARRGVVVGTMNNPNSAGYNDLPERIENPSVLVSFELPMFWRYYDKRPVGIVCDARSAYDGSYIVPFSDSSQILCPSAWVRDAVRERTQRKATIWRFGIDTEAFVPVERARGETLRFLHFAADNGQFRKGADIAVNAFVQAFGDRTDVELVLHSTQNSSFERRTDRARQSYGPMPPAALAEFYRSFDAVIYSSRAEAFASVAIEAAACGVPVIHSGATGMADISDLGLTVAHRTRESNDGTGTWSEPQADSIADRLREIDEAYDRVRAQAFEQADAVRSRFSWASAVAAFFRHL